MKYILITVQLEGAAADIQEMFPVNPCPAEPG